VAIDFASTVDRHALSRLLARADIVVASARPRAFVQLGCAPEALLAERPGLTWISITGYGRSGAGANWAAFGDDAATAAGLAMATGHAAGDDGPLFCADAIADPLTGVHAAVAALAAWQRGGGVLASLALRDVAAHVMAFGPPTRAPAITARTRLDGTCAWEVHVDGARQTVRSPRARRPSEAARPLGADTERVLRELHV
jgi:crotonobetainyl-CoA:carnitine CoA-transferase CaiB-like acyl-CoA transferase